MSIETGRPAPADYGQLPQENEPPHRFYEKALEALWRFSDFTEHFKGGNKDNIQALAVVINRMLAEDYDQLTPPRNRLIPDDSESDYADYQRALTTIEQYIQENKAHH
jgi:hypothetical protein